MLKTIDFAGMRYTYDDTLFPNENTQIGELFVCFDISSTYLDLILSITRLEWILQKSKETLSENGNKFNLRFWYKIVKSEPIPEIPVLKEGMTIYHIGYGKGKVVEILPDNERIVCTFDSTSKYNSRYFFRYTGFNIENTAQVLSFQPIILPKFEFKLEPKRVYIKDKINTDNLSDTMKRCKLIEHAILLIESGKKLFYIDGNVNLVVMVVFYCNVFDSDIDLSRVYYYE